MKVILLQNIARIGRRFEVKDVPKGHALNFLIPRKMAEPATPESLKRLEARTARQETDRVSADEALLAAFGELNGKTVEFSVDANEKGHLFKGVKAIDIVQYLHTKGIELNAEAIMLDHPIKEIGKHIILFSAGATKGEFTLAIVPK